jgi:hypothetical protein
MISSLEAISGNVAVDLAILILAGVGIAHILGAGADFIDRVRKSRRRLKTMRSTLEIKNSELTALRQLLYSARQEAAAHRQLLSEERRDQLSLAFFMTDTSAKTDHSELDTQLRKAASRPQFDA